MNTAMQLKALIRNLSKEKNISAQILLRSYMMERFLERTSLSHYKNNFILKGGTLIASITGIDTRLTMDIDATIKGVEISPESIRTMFDDICSIPIDDGVTMTVREIESIRDEAEYAGVRVSIDTCFDGVRQTLKVDITTGDAITPRAINYTFNLMFEERSIELLSYNLETVLAEKMETIISRSTANTRMRDFYDVYILLKLQAETINEEILSRALAATAAKRGTAEVLLDAPQIINEVEKNQTMQALWARYQRKYNYAAALSWEDAINAVKAMAKLLRLQP